MMKKAIVSSLLLLTSLLCLAQKDLITVKGVVNDDSGNPLPGVVVFQDGSKSNGSITDGNGAYSLSVPSNATIVFNSLGYTEVREAVKGRASISVVMKEENLSIDAAEVVSVGYGSVARRDLTGSVSKVDMDNITKSTTMNFDQAIAGRVAGVVVSTGDGSLGAEANIVIRGSNSLTQSSEPLYVVDGFPTESSLAVSLNPADIQSIDILKDASATAIYGARGANGVIVITTKSGIEGKPVINFSASWTGSKIAKKVNILDAYGFVQLHDDYSKSINGNNIYLNYKDEQGAIHYNYYSVDDYKNVEGVDWQDQIYRPALTQDYNVSLSGGSKTAGNTYNITAAYLNQDGIITNSNFQRFNVKANFQQKLGKKVIVNVNGNFSRSTTMGNTPSSSANASSSSSYLMYSVWGYRPCKPIYLGSVSDDFINSLIDTEVVNADDQRFNPAASVRNEYRRRVYDLLNVNGAFNWDIVQGLRLRISGGLMLSNTQNERFDNENTSTGWSGSSLGWGVNGAIYSTRVKNIVNENTLNYNKTFAKAHHLKALVGLTFQHQGLNYTGVSSRQMTTSSLGLNGLHTGKYQPVTPYEYNWGLMSWLGRVNYDYKYRYYFTASFRADGSSKFPTQNRWGYFPSASVAWNFNRENWMKQFDWLNNGKIRFSWGLTGNNRTTTPYDFYSQVTTSPGSTESFDYVIDGKIVPGYFPNNMSNEKLKWETTEQYDLGLDLGFFDNRIKFTFDAYLKNTRDLLLNATLPSSSGYTAAMINIGSIRNKGLEFTLDVVPVRKKNFEWNMNFNVGINRNTVTALSTDQTTLISRISWDQRFSSQYPYITKIGMPTGMMFGYLYEGTYKADEFVNGTTLKDGIPYLSSLTRANIRPGDPKYKDINGDGIVDEDDRTIIGCGQPLASGGWSNSFNFYGFDVNFFFQWSYGNNALNANRLMFENYQGTNLNQFATMANCYSERHPDSDIPRAHANGMWVYSSRVVEDASYVRLKTASIGYTFPDKWLKRVHITGLRVYVSGENIFTLTNYSGPDPEVSTRNSVLTPGFDWSPYARARSITGGISFKL